ncbi:MAG TPA: carbon-nitrogen hydrolase family protein, partial [Nitrospiria bacterium]
MLTVAAVQMQSQPYRVDENLEKAEGYLRQASAKGAQVVVLPELFNTGYCYSARNFEAAEAISGRTARWFRSMGKRFELFVAGAMIEKDRGRYYDTMVLGTPEGRIVSYRKRRLAMQEKCYFTPGDYPLIIYTELGRIGTGICADMLDRGVWERYRDKVDLLIVSSAWADFTTGRIPFARTPLNRRITEMTRELPRRLAASLGAPVVYANLCGPFNSTLPLLYPYDVGAEFAGNSSIHDAEGRRVMGLEKQEGLVITR